MITESFLGTSLTTDLQPFPSESYNDNYLLFFNAEFKHTNLSFYQLYYFCNTSIVTLLIHINILLFSIFFPNL